MKDMPFTSRPRSKIAALLFVASAMVGTCASSSSSSKKSEVHLSGQEEEPKVKPATMQEKAKALLKGEELAHHLLKVS